MNESYIFFCKKLTAAPKNPQFAILGIKIVQKDLLDKKLDFKPVCSVLKIFVWKL